MEDNITSSIMTQMVDSKYEIFVDNFPKHERFETYLQDRPHSDG